VYHIEESTFWSGHRNIVLLFYAFHANPQFRTDFPVLILFPVHLNRPAQIAHTGNSVIPLEYDTGTLQYIFQGDIRWTKQAASHLLHVVYTLRINASSRITDFSFIGIVMERFRQPTAVIDVGQHHQRLHCKHCPRACENSLQYINL
jgi:hypothetical protein